MKRILSLFLIINVLVFVAVFANTRAEVSMEESKKRAAEEPQKKVKTEKVPYTIINGPLIMRDNRLFLKESDEKLYRITDKENLQVYASLSALVKEAVQQNKGVKAVLWGKPGTFGQLAARTVKYTNDGKVELNEGEEINYIDFGVMQTEQTEYIPIEEIKQIKIASASEVAYSPPLLLPTIRIIGKVTGVYFQKVIPYIEIKAEEVKEPKIIIIPSNIRVLKVMEGQLVGYSPKGSLNIGSKVELWYEQQGDINTAKSIVLLSK